MRPIVLIGMMGSGKTTIGKKLAMDLNLSWVDTDLYIENTKHQSISSIFNMHDNVLENFLNYLTAIRNFSAHGNRLYCFVGSKPLIDTQVHNKLGILQNQGQYVQGRNDLFAAVIALKYLLSNREFNYFLKSLIGAVNKLSAKLSVISIDKVLTVMGFPPNWRKILYI